MRRLYVCTLLCAVCLLCLAASALAETVSLDGIVYEIKDGYATFAGFADGATSISAHATVNGYPVTYLYSGEDLEGIIESSAAKELIIAPELSALDSSGLYFSSLQHLCPKLEKIVLPGTVTSIGDTLLYGLENLREFSVAEDNPLWQDIDGVLYSKNGHTLLIFPKGREGGYDAPAGVQAIGPEAFGYNTHLTRLTIPEGVTILEQGALSGASALEDVSLPASLVFLDRALPDSGSLQTIKVAEGNQVFASVDGVLFSKDLTGIIRFPVGRGGVYEIPGGVAVISEDAFGSNSQLTGLTIPEGVTQLTNGVLTSLNGLEQLSLPASLQTIGEWALPGGGKLQSVTVADESKSFQAYEGALFSRDGKTLLYCPPGKSGAYEIPLATQAIARYAFGSTQGLTSLTIPDGVTAIPEYAFAGLAGLREIHLPASLKEIGEGALPPYGSLERVEVDPGNTRYKSIGGVLFEGDELTFYPSGHPGQSYDVPVGTKSIVQRAFADCKALKTVSIPRGVTKIGEMTFSNCTALERVSLPITLTEIGIGAFSDCIALSGASLPPGVEVIGEYAFSNCASLESINLPAALKTIGQNAFADCVALSGITLPGGLETLGQYAFSNCSKLQKVYIPDSVRGIGNYAFLGSGPEFAIFAAKDSAGYWYAWEYGFLWSAPESGEPAQVKAVDRQTQSAVVNSGQSSLSLSSKPGKGGKSLGKYQNGTTVQVIDTDGDWAHVALYVKEGYMPLDSLMLTDPFNTLVRISWGRKNRERKEPLRLYDEPSEDAPSKTITEDVTMRILDTQGVWCRVKLSDREGYIPAQWLEMATSQRQDYESNITYRVVANPDFHDRLHLRKEPSTKSQSLGRYFNGTQVETLGDIQDGWAHVRVDGKEGYMMLKYLSLIYFGGESALLSPG
jgi:uncharacterized protein YgiM (DUF1202 family)